ncbi:hypothetical protein ABZX92_43610 [Lentzea sp. NPDC006480]|uniref:hypothetical protein n=1 Tax=Lentzea sp. NPDC006480 TaxID=3157176 RepID=UPI0033AB1BAB
MTAPETPLPSPPGMKITEENKLKGSLFIEAYGSLIDGIGKDAESETEKALDITFNAIGAASATVMLAIDPLGSIIGAGVGWLIEHVSFLRDALNQLMGNPEEIQANVEATKKQAVDLRTLAEDHKNGLATFDGWTGQSSERFKASMDGMYQELDDLANAVENKAKIVAIMGMLVTVLRDIVRDLIAQLIGGLIGGAILAAAAMIPTFGASIPAFIGFAVGKAVALGVNIASRVARVVAALGRQMKRIGDLDDIMKKISKGWERFENSADVAEISYEGWKAQRDVGKDVDAARGGSGGGGGNTPPGASGGKTAQDTLAQARVGTVMDADGGKAEALRAQAHVGTVMDADGGKAEALRAQSATPMHMVSGRTEMDSLAHPVARTQMDAAEPMQALRRVDAAEPMHAVRPTHMDAAEPMQALRRVDAAEPMQALRHVDAAEPMQPLQRMDAVQPAHLTMPTRMDAVEPLQPMHRMDAVEPMQPLQRMSAVEAPMAPTHMNVASDSTMTSGVSMTSSAPVHHDALQPREMYLTESTPAEPVQSVAAWDTTPRMSPTFEAAQPTESYNPLQARTAYSSVDAVPAEPVQYAAGYEAPAQSGGAPVQPTRPTATERPTRQSGQ